MAKPKAAKPTKKSTRTTGPTIPPSPAPPPEGVVIAAKLPLDSGGATRQSVGDGYATLTTQTGVPIADDENHLRVGPRGPMLLQTRHKSQAHPNSIQANSP